MQNLVILSSVLLSTVYTPDTGFGGEQFYMLRSTRSYGKPTLGLHSCFKFNAALQLELQVSVIRVLRAQASMAPRLFESVISPILFFLSSMPDSTVRQHFPVLCPFPAFDCFFPPIVSVHFTPPSC